MDDLLRQIQRLQVREVELSQEKTKQDKIFLGKVRFRLIKFIFRSVSLSETWHSSGVELMSLKKSSGLFLNESMNLTIYVLN